MAGLSRQEATRLRRLHLAFFLLPPAWIVLFFFVAQALPDPQSEFGIVAWGALFLGPLAVGLFGTVLVERRIWRAAAPKGAQRWKTVAVSWFTPFGSVQAVDRLLEDAVRKGEDNAT